jgi:hypothetical protein
VILKFSSESSVHYVYREWASKFSYRTRAITGDDNDPFIAAESYINRSRPDGSATSTSSSSAARINDVPLTEQQQHHDHGARAISNSSHHHRGLLAAKLENLKIELDDKMTTMTALLPLSPLPSSRALSRVELKAPPRVEL